MDLKYQEYRFPGLIDKNTGRGLHTEVPAGIATRLVSTNIILFFLPDYCNIF